MRNPLGPRPRRLAGWAERAGRAFRVEDPPGRLGGGLLERLRGAGDRGRRLDQLAGEGAEEATPAQVDRGGRRAGAVASDRSASPDRPRPPRSRRVGLVRALSGTTGGSGNLALSVGWSVST